MKIQLIKTKDDLTKNTYLSSLKEGDLFVAVGFARELWRKAEKHAFNLNTGEKVLLENDPNWQVSPSNWLVFPITEILENYVEE